MERMQREKLEVISKMERRQMDSIGPSVLRAPAEQTKVATVFGN